MKFLLEFKNYNDISIIQNTVEDSFFSEVDESLSPKVKESFLLLSGQDIEDVVAYLLTIKTP